MNISELTIVFDPAKDEANVLKHGISLSMVREVLMNIVEITPDRRRDYGEERFITAGYIGQRLYIAVWTMRNEQVRAISLRKANKREVKYYEH